MPPSKQNDPSIPTTKSTFLTRQVALLSTPLLPPIPTSTSLPSTTIDPLLTKLNKKITSHNRLAFPIQSRRHVVEQIEGIYWRDVLADGNGRLRRGVETVVKWDMDFTRGEGVDGLPVRWEDVVVCGGEGKKRKRALEDGEGDDGNDYEEEEAGSTKRQRRQTRNRQEEKDQARSSETDSTTDTETNSPTSPHYSTLHTSLTTKLARRASLLTKLSALKQLQSRLEPFEDPRGDVQPNLAYKGNKEVEGEVARMRVLLVRCEGVVRAARVGDGEVREGMSGMEGQGEEEGQEGQGEGGGRHGERGVIRLEAVLGLS